MMRKLKFVPILILVLIGVSKTSTADELSDGVDAYERSDFDTALVLLMPLAEANNPLAQAIIGRSYAKGQGVDRDDTIAVMWYQRSADQGNVRGQLGLGFMYTEGRGVVQNYTESILWTQKAAAQENAKAQHNLAVAYDKGRGVRRDDGIAEYWHRKAATLGFLPSQIVLGRKYRKGEGVKRDIIEAVKWYQMAADQGHPLALISVGILYNEIGNLYYVGDGVDKDRIIAADWFFKAAKAGNSIAQDRLGNMYIGGDGVKQDNVAGFKWINRAAEYGNWQSQLFLYKFYLDASKALPRNLAHAYKWILIANRDGGQSVEEITAPLIQKLEQGLTAKQRETGERMAKEWKPKIEDAGTLASVSEVVPENTDKSTVGNLEYVPVNGEYESEYVECLLPNHLQPVYHKRRGCIDGGGVEKTENTESTQQSSLIQAVESRSYTLVKHCKFGGSVHTENVTVVDSDKSAVLASHKEHKYEQCLTLLHDGPSFTKGDIIIPDRNLINTQQVFKVYIQCKTSNHKPFPIKIMHDSEAAANSLVENGTLKCWVYK